MYINMHMLHRAPSPQLVHQLREAYPEDALPQTVFDRLVGEPDTALISHEAGVVPYVRPNPGVSRPLMYVPGFGEGIVNKLPFAAELLSREYDVILPGQNRATHLRGRRASGIQAENYESILAAEGLAGTPVDFMAHSYGSFVLEAMVQRSPESFCESTAFLLAPAGVGNPKSYEGHGMARRWLAMLGSESHKSEQDFPDHTGETGRASLGVLSNSLWRTGAEVAEMWRSQIGLIDLSKRIGHLVVVAYAEDKMHPQDLIVPESPLVMMLQRDLSNATWISPISLQHMPDGMIRGGHCAVHDDEQLNPSRVAGAIDQILRPKPLAA